MPDFGSTRKLLLFGGLGVFALGWGGGLLLGVLRPEPSPEPESKAPQVVDADEFAPEQEPTRKSSSLLEQVFGLDDLEEERPSKPRPAPSPPPVANPAFDSAQEDAVEPDLGSSENAKKKADTRTPDQDAPVVLEETGDEDGKAAPPPAQQNSSRPEEDPGASVELKETPSSKKEFLDDNPYK